MILKLGSTGQPVRILQKALHVLEDGVFGKCTREAVIAFQRDHNLTADGIVGEKTWALITKPSNVKSSRRITEIIVHCTATPEGQDKTVEQIRREHMTPKSKGGNGWSDIGYHYVVDLHGKVHNGRDINIAGAHVSGHNSNSIGVVYVGGLENIPGVPYAKLKAKDTRTPEQKAALLRLLKDLHVLYPNAKILGHRDCSPDKNGDGVISPWEWLKSCPSFDAKQEYQDI
jgi:N-acetyl-anhydromuramyl-L-alanine amidase AmpD